MVDAHGKDQRWETLALKVNDALLTIEQEFEVQSDAAYPIVHVVGPPRSGTTLAMQILTSSLELGYIDNVAAAFWRAPVVGVELSKHLNGDRRDTSWQSSFGRTLLPHEPHEFGYFWRELLGYRSMAQDDRPSGPLDGAIVRARLAAITRAFGLPTVFKSFLAAWHLAELKALLPETIVVRLRRDSVDTAMSILRFREEARGDRSEWVSVRPSAPIDWEAMSPPEQVAAQIHFTDFQLDRQLTDYPMDDVLEIDYLQMCEDPMSLVTSVQRKLFDMGRNVALVEKPVAQFPRSRDEDDRDLGPVRAAVDRLAGESRTT